MKIPKTTKWNTHYRPLFLVTFLVALIILCVWLHTRNEPTQIEQSISIEKISEDIYLEALDKEKDSLVWDGKSDPPAYPEPESADYYQVLVHDKGYSDALPINAKIYFAITQNEGLVEKSYFTLMEMPVSPRYQNVITYATDGQNNNVFLKLEISVVGYYDSVGRPLQSKEFAYSLSFFCNLETLDIDRLHVS